MNIESLIEKAREQRGSDVHLVQGLPPKCRVDGSIQNLEEDRLDKEQCLRFAHELAGEDFPQLEQAGEVDLARTIAGVRCRINVFRQQGAYSAAIRLLNDHIPPLEELGLPPVAQEFCSYHQGLVLITGETGSGKSTTLASLLDRINHTKPVHILTLEDPVEYIYTPDQSLINQREIGRDTMSFAAGLRAALREDPDVILVGEMRDYETISAALLAAETGHLVLSTLHTTGAAQTVERIIDACPAEGQNQVRIQLAGTLKGIVSQCLIPCGGGVTRIAATELLVSTDSILNLIREGKTHQIPSMMQVGADNGMHTLNMDLGRLVREGYITREDALSYTNNKAEIAQYL